MKQRLKRKDSFFGLHFDLHTSEHDEAYGADTDEEMLEVLLDRVQPDFVQYDCKGHAGYAGYPTHVGTPSPGIVKDALTTWRKVTADKGVALYIHYSGVLDGAAVAAHPEWAAVTADGEAFDPPWITSTFSPYVDELLIPQLKEAIGSYELDGVWADGESWGAKLDYSPAALAAWQAETGRSEAPRAPGDEHWQEWKEFHRDRFEQYMRHWVDEVHATYPDAQLCSNWMYSIAAPRPVDANVDFLSGDYSPIYSADVGRRQARYLANCGMPWDLMSWGFIQNGQEFRHWKTPEQLEQEASIVLMQGGGFQVYYKPTRSGYVPAGIADIAGEVADFCRARQDVSFRSTSVPQVALLFSTETMWHECESPYDPEPEKLFDELHGALHALLERHYSVDVFSEHQLLPQIDEFPLVVIAHATRIEEATRERLLAYVEQGGSLMLLGSETTAPFKDVLGVDFDHDPVQVAASLPVPGGLANASGTWQAVTTTDAEAVLSRFGTIDTRGEGVVAATVASLGRGRIGAVYGPVAIAFFQTHHPRLRAVIGDLAQRLFPTPDVELDAPPCVDIALRHTADGRTCVHLLNLANSQRSKYYVGADHVPPVGPLTMRLKLGTRPGRITWEPDGVELEWDWSEGRACIRVPSLHVHGAVLIASQGAGQGS